MASPRRRLVGCLALCVFTSSFAGAPSKPVLAVGIAPQPLKEALAAFGEQTHLQLFYVSAIAKTRSSKGARAGRPPSEALAALLEGTGLEFEWVNDRAVRIFAPPGASSTAPRRGAVTSGRRSGGVSENPLPKLEEVLVTANRRLEEASKVPIDMVVWSQEDLERAGIKDVSEIASLTPSMQFDMTPDSGPGAITFLSIRGVNDRSASMTGLYLDDTPIPPARGYTFLRSLPFTFDLDRVEVLRGPQLQLFGEGNQGGAVRFISNPPSLTTTTALAESELATTQRGGMSYEAGAAVGGPLIQDALGFRLSAWRRLEGGFVDRVDPFTRAIVDHDANHSSSTTLRGALTLAPTAAVRITPSLTYTSYALHDSPVFFTNLSSVGTGQLLNGMLLRQPDRDTFYLGALKITARLGAVDLSTVSSYFHRTFATVVDLTNYSDWGSPLGSGYPLDPRDAVAAYHDLRQATFRQELRLASADPNEVVSWDTGLFYSTDRVRDSDQFTAAQGVPGQFLGPVDLQNTGVSGQTRLAAYGEVSLRMLERLTVSAGLHSERTHYSAVTELPPVLRSVGADSAVLPRFKLSYQASERVLLYVTAAKGYGSGGLWWSLVECPGEAPARIGTDTLWSYEVGMKSGFLDGRVQLDTGFFHIAWHNGEGYSGYIPCNAPYLGTPGAAASNGFDVAARAFVGSHVKIGFALAYTDARYTRTFTQDGVVIVRKGEAVGTLPYVISPWNVTTSVDYTAALAHESTADFRVENVFRSRNPGPFQDDDPASPNYSPGSRPDPSTNRLNVRASVQRSSYGLALFVTNVLDAQPIVLRKKDLAYPAAFATTFRPRTVGLNASWRF
jgi:outer membrane receptor protein involved in Fe transport